MGFTQKGTGVAITAVIAAIKQIDNRTYTAMSCDSQFTRGMRKLKLKDTAKIIKFPYFYVGFAGIASLQTLLYEMQIEKSLLKRAFMRMRDKSDAVVFCRTVFNELKARMDETGDPEALDGSGDLLIMTESAIYNVDRYCFVLEGTDFLTLGSGDTELIGHMNAIYDKIATPEELEQGCRDAVKTACTYNTGCAEPIHSFLYAKS